MMKRFDIRNKICLITGASSGIGEATARLFAENGGHIALVGRRTQVLNEIEKSLVSSGHSAKAFTVDLEKSETVPGLVKNIADHFKKPVSVLVNCAGIAVLGKTEDVPAAEYQKSFQLNVLAPILLSQSVIPGMKAQQCGQIINITSGVGSRGLPGVSAYCLSKFALNGFTESLRVELMPFGIDVLSVSPGLTKTAFHQNKKTFGTLPDSFSEGVAQDAKSVALEILKASQYCKRNTILSFRTRVSAWIQFFFPCLMDRILLKMSLKK